MLFVTEDHFFFGFVVLSILDFVLDVCYQFLSEVEGFLDLLKIWHKRVLFKWTLAPRYHSILRRLWMQ